MGTGMESKIEWRRKFMNAYDIVFMGHMCIDEIAPFKGKVKIAPGSAVLCGAIAAARIGRKVAVVTKLAKKDEGILDLMKEAGIDTYIIEARETSYMKVIHPTADVDVREMYLEKSAGFFNIDEVPVIKSEYLHLAGISDQEFTLDLITGLKEKGFRLSADMQSFVRQVNPSTKKVIYNDVPDKKAIIRMVDKVKLDIVEAKILTGTDDIEKAAILIEEWGCHETVITKSEGILARVNGKTYCETFSNSGVTGRTGRGDTAFAAYLSYRMDHDAAESLKFAAALVSIKMDAPGPFSGTMDDVLRRMIEKHM
jgi:sugar/nucleoside kinase (ribokinase family)